MKQINFTCRECGKPLSYFVQPAMMPGREGHGYVTCENRGPCSLADATIADNTEYRTRRDNYAPIVIPKR